MLNSILKGNGVISENEKYILYQPKNTQDTNYHLISKVSRLDYLIDIHEIHNQEDYDNMEDFYQEYSLSFNDLISLKDIDNIKEYSWLVKEV